MYPFLGSIRPFFNNPTASVPVIFYPVPLSLDVTVPPNPFVLRFFDVRENLDQTRLGTVQGDVTFYGGPLPVNAPGSPCGSADQWANGVDYDVWLAGGYTCDCPAMSFPTYVETISCPDGTLVISPISGNVLAQLNLARANTWTAQQSFQAGLKATGGLAEVNNAAVPPATNATSLQLRALDDGTTVLTCSVSPLAGGGPNEVNLVFAPDPTGTLTLLKITATNAGAAKDTALQLTDAGLVTHTGLTGTIGFGATAYGGIVDSLGGTFQLQFPVEVTGINLGCVPYVGSDGLLESAIGTDFFFDYDGSLGPLATPGTLYVGGENSGDNAGTLALFDASATAWQTVFINAGVMELSVGINSLGIGQFQSGLTVANGTTTDTLQVTLTSTFNGLVTGMSGLAMTGGITTDTLTITSQAGFILTGQTTGPGTHTGTLTNAPSAGNPTLWLPVLANGVLRHIPCW